MKLNNSVDEFYLFLAGGVGAAKLLDGFNQIINQSKLKIIVNTGDDIELFGLKICPDLDIITYTLANKVDKKKGWGFKNDSFNCLEILKKYYETGWFNAGDKDLATHIYRTDLFSKGFKKSEITQKICKSLGVSAHILPMCDESVETYIKTSEGNIHFEEYYIKERCEPEILDVFFKGIEKAKPLKITLKLIENAKKIIICPSNPIVSIGTILSIQEIWNMLKEVKKKSIWGKSHNKRRNSKRTC